MSLLRGLNFLAGFDPRSDFCCQMYFGNLFVDVIQNCFCLLVIHTFWRVEYDGVVAHEPHIVVKLLDGVVRVETRADGREIHRLFDDQRVIGDKSGVNRIRKDLVSVFSAQDEKSMTQIGTFVSHQTPNLGPRRASFSSLASPAQVMARVAAEAV